MQASTERFTNSKGVYRAAFIVVAIILWWLCAEVFFPDVIPGVWSTFKATGELLVSAPFYEHILQTGERVLVGFLVAFTISMIIGISMGKSRKVEAFFEIYVVLGLSQPGLFVAMIMLVALGLKGSTAIIILAFLATPLITVPIWQGTKRLDDEIDQMGAAFGYSTATKVRKVIIPQLLSPIMAAVRQGMGITWKYVVMVEMLGLDSGVGQQVTRNFQMFDLEGVVKWTLGYLGVILIIEYLVLRNIEKSLFYWRDHSVKKKSLIQRYANHKTSEVANHE